MQERKIIDWPITLVESKYNRWYENLVIKAKNRAKPEGYTERHHIIPRSLGGSNSKDNLVDFTAREHYIAHLLLWKMKFSPKHHNKMTMALHIMVNGSGNEKQDRSYLVSARLYEAHRKDLRKVMSETLTGPGNPFYGKTHTEATRQKIVEANARTKAVRSAKLTGEGNGFYGKKHTAEALAKIGEESAKLHTPERKKAYSDRMKIRWKNPEYIQEMKEKMSVINAAKDYKEIARKVVETKKRLGIKSILTHEGKQRLLIALARTKQCEHCNKEVRLTHYGRWHGDKCKQKA
jgi:hypothetical protein